MSEGPYDFIEGISPRAHLKERIQIEVERAHRQGAEVSLIMLDIDHFKSINDAFGHRRGDQALVEIASLIKSQVRQSDEVFRYGGDEFIILLPNTSKSQAIGLAERIMHMVQETRLGTNPPLQMSVSLGVASCPTDTATAVELFERADQRHYHSKVLGRSRVTFEDADPSLYESRGEPDRLIERDASLARLKHFLNAPSAPGRDVLYIHGRRGAGRTRFLQEVRTLFNLHGYASLWVAGHPGLQSRWQGAISDALQAWPDSPSFLTPQSLAAFFAGEIERRDLNGLVVLVDDWYCLDEASLELVRALGRAEGFRRIVLAYHDERETPPWEALKSEAFRIDLHALSQSGVRIWLRNSVRQELPDSTVQLITRISEGLPARLAKITTWMVSRPETHLELWEEDRLEQELSGLFRPTPAQFSRLMNESVSFFGREEELRQIKTSLREKRVLWLIGNKGIGKTTLAWQAAREMYEQYPDGVFLVNFARLASSRFVVQTIAQTLSIPLAPRLEPLPQLLEGLSSRQMLLILDNVDSAPEAVPVITQLAARTTSVRVLATSSEQLDPAGAAVVRVQGLPVPTAQADDGEAYPSVQLFLQRAGLRGSPEADIRSISRICQLVDGSPLGIELASAWTSTLSCTQIAQRIEESISFLGSSETTHQGRSLMAVFDAVIELFSQAELRTLQALALFKGDFSHTAALHIAGASTFFLDALASKFLLRRHAVRRYENVHSFGMYLRQQLMSDPALFEEITGRYAEYYLGLLQPADDEGQDSPTDFSSELENIRHAWTLMESQGRYRLLESVLSPWIGLLRINGFFLEAIDYLRRIDAKPNWDPGELSDATRFRIQVKSFLGEHYYHVGKYEDGIAILEDGLALFGSDSALYSREQAHLYRLLGDNHRSLSHFAEAKQVYTLGRAIAEQAGDREMLYFILNSLAITEYFTGDNAAARQYLERTLEIARQMGDQAKIAQSLNNLGNVLYERGELDAAKQIQTEAVSLLRGTEPKTLQGAMLDTMGKILAACGEYKAASQTFLRALDLLRDLQAIPLILEILTGIAELWAQAGESSRALSLVGNFVDHPAATSETRDRLRRLYQRLQESGVEAASADWTTGEMKDVVNTVIRRLQNAVP